MYWYWYWYWYNWCFCVFVLLLSSAFHLSSALGSISSIAVSYGDKGPVFCGLNSDGSHLATCYGSNSGITYSTPSTLSFTGLTAGDGFVCGLLRLSNLPYCWGTSPYIHIGIPQPLSPSAHYSDIAAGDYHLCALRRPLTGLRRNSSLVDCWGYNMTTSFSFSAPIHSLSAGSDFNCAIFSHNRSAFCWGQHSSSPPPSLRFQSLSAGGYHACGLLEGVDSLPVCWGRQDDLQPPPAQPLLSLAGGRFHSCGIRAADRRVLCWGFLVNPSTPAPDSLRLYEITSGNYFSCGIMAEKSLMPVCWGSGFPTSLPLPVPPGECPCSSGFYELRNSHPLCTCVPCSAPRCPPRMYLQSQCSATSDRVCVDLNDHRFWSLQLPVFVAEIAFAVFLIAVVSATAVLYVRYRLRDCRCSDEAPAVPRKKARVAAAASELKLHRAQMFRYSDLERATGGFREESLVGKGSFSYVFRGVLEGGAVVAVKRAIVSPNIHKNWKEFHTELDLLSRLNHAHLLNLLGYCEEGEERLLVYEYMANGSLHQHLHGNGNTNANAKPLLDWVRRVTIAVQAARGIEYLHGYACPPVIHRDIKSSNILIDEEHNARVADFGLSLLGPADSCSPLPELPAGTLGYLDPEYYRLHYLTTKSDVYSFGVLLLEILSGRKAIHVQREDGNAVNIVEWAVPLVKAGETVAILDPALKLPPDLEALKRIANVACKCVRMRGKERPSMDKVTTSLERALAMLMGSPCSEQPILPTEVVLGSSRLHKKPSQRSSNRSVSETDVVVVVTGGEGDDQRCEFRAPSWITFPSVASSQRRKSSVSEADVEGRNLEARNINNNNHDGLRSLEEEICPASPQENLFLHHNF